MKQPEILGGMHVFRSQCKEGRPRGGRTYFVQRKRELPNAVWKKLVYNEKRVEKKRWCN